MKIDFATAAKIISEQNNILILCHDHPDGDTLGSGFALCRALTAMGKKARVECADKIPQKYSYMYEGLKKEEFTPEFIMCVDVADKKLLGAMEEKYGDKISLCIDHHGSNRLFAENTCLDFSAAANAENIYRVIKELGAEFTKEIADCIYTGLTTDTGCFRYANVTAQTHIIAAEMISLGADAAEINRVMFETKSRAYVALERMALDSMEMHCGEKIALVCLTQDMFKESGADESDVDGIASIPRQIEGVLAGATIRERKDGKFKVSLRTHAPVNASEICALLGGGGHSRAAGCEIDAPLENAKKLLLDTMIKYFDENSLV